jgi:hypothetical protein
MSVNNEMKKYPIKEEVVAYFNALAKTLSEECKYTYQDYDILSGDSVQFGR